MRIELSENINMVHITMLSMRCKMSANIRFILTYKRFCMFFITTMSICAMVFGTMMEGVYLFA